MQTAEIEKKVQEQLEKVSDKVPVEVKGFLNEYGWPLVYGLIGVLVILLILRILKLFSKPAGKRKNKPISSKQWQENTLEIDLSKIKNHAFPPGKKRITVKGTPVRLGVLIFAKAGGNGPEPNEEQAESLLNFITPNLGDLAMRDYPEVKIWEAQYSPEGFTQLFNQNVRVPEPKGQKSRWITISGLVRLGPDKVHVGMAVLADTPNQIRTINLNGDQWLDILRIG